MGIDPLLNAPPPPPHVTRPPASYSTLLCIPGLALTIGGSDARVLLGAFCLFLGFAVATVLSAKGVSSTGQSIPVLRFPDGARQLATPNVPRQHRRYRGDPPDPRQLVDR